MFILVTSFLFRHQVQTLLSAASNGHAEVVKIVLEQLGEDGCNERNKDGWTALMFASWKDHIDVVDLLLELDENAQIDIDASVGGGWTALIIAAFNGHWRIVERLLLKGASLQSTSMTALQMAKMSHEDVDSFDKLRTINIIKTALKN